MKQRTVLFAALGCALCALAPAALAFQPLVTDDTGTQGAGGNQIEAAYTRDHATTTGASATTRTVPLVYTRGLTDSLDVFVQANHVALRSDPPPSDDSGAGNASIGFKWRFFENEASKTGGAFKTEILLPVSSGSEAVGLGNGRTSYALTGILTQETGFGAIHANLVGSRDNFDDPTIPGVRTVRFSVAPVWDVSETWKLALDLGAESARAGGVTTRSSFAQIGAIWSPNKDLDFALGFIRARDDATPRTTTDTVTLGVTWRFR